MAITGEAKTYRKEIAKRYEKETTLDELHNISNHDIYIGEHNTFQLGNETFVFKNDLLFEAVRLLQEDKRNIILLFYFLEMTDEEIAQTMKAIRRTINHKRNKALKELKKYLEDWNAYW